MGRPARRGGHFSRFNSAPGRLAQGVPVFRHRICGRARLALIQGWTIAAAARLLHIAFPRHDPLPRRVELDLPGQLAQEIVGYPVAANSPYLKRGLLPSWARPTLVVRSEKILSPAEAEPVRTRMSSCWRRRRRRRRLTAFLSTCRPRRRGTRGWSATSSSRATSRSVRLRRFMGSRLPPLTRPQRSRTTLARSSSARRGRASDTARADRAGRASRHARPRQHRWAAPRGGRDRADDLIAWLKKAARKLWSMLD